MEIKTILVIILCIGIALGAIFLRNRKKKK